MAFDAPRALSQQTPEPDQLQDWLKRQLIPAFLSVRNLFATLSQAFNTGAIPFGGVTFRVVTGAPTQNDADGSVAFRVDGGAGTTLYHREAGVWIGRA